MKKSLKIPNLEIARIKLLSSNDTEREKKQQKSLTQSKKTIAPYNEASSSFSYVSLGYAVINKNQYAHQMQKAEKQWNLLEDNKTVTYIDLRLYNRALQEGAPNNDGIWNGERARKHIKTPPPFWMTDVAKIIYLLLVALVFYFLINAYLIKRRRNRYKQIKACKLKQEAIISKTMMDSFTSVIHEMKTPLSLIQAPLEEIIMSGDGNSETKDNLSIIERNCNQLSILISQSLVLRDMNPTQYSVNAKRVSLNKVVSDVYEQFKKAIDTQGIDFHLRTPKNEIIAYTDTFALHRIIGNLLTNAIKYTDGTIILGMKQVSTKVYQLSIEDNGKGISDTNKELVFDPFFQIKQSDRNTGTGIGLALSKCLAKVLNGTIDVVDAVPTGAIFKFTFSDLAIQETPKSAAENNKRVIKDIKTSYPKDSWTKQYSLLIVDDNMEMVSYLENTLQNDYRIYVAYSADEGLEMLDKIAVIDLIISDIMMQGIDGIEFIRIVRSNLNHSHIPIILLSARTDSATKAEGLSSGANVFIEKPFSTLYLEAQINAVFENRKRLIEVFNKTPLASYTTLVGNKQDQDFFQRLDAEIEANISDDKFNVDMLSDCLGLSRSNLQRKFKSICGTTPGEYLRNYRLKRACLLLLENDMRINEVAFKVGFSSASYFTKVFTKMYDMSPKEFIAKHDKSKEKE